MSLHSEWNVIHDRVTYVALCGMRDAMRLVPRVHHMRARASIETRETRDEQCTAQLAQIACIWNGNGYIIYINICSNVQMFMFICVCVLNVSGVSNSVLCAIVSACILFNIRHSVLYFNRAKACSMSIPLCLLALIPLARIYHSRISRVTMAETTTATESREFFHSFSILITQIVVFI